MKDLEDQLATEDNDLKAMGLYKKLQREKRNEYFVNNYLNRLEKVSSVSFDPHSCRYTFTAAEGVLDYYPKADKLLIRSLNKWIIPGLPYIVKHIIK